MKEAPQRYQDLPQQYLLNQPDIDLQHAVLFSLFAFVQRQLDAGEVDNPEALMTTLRDYVLFHLSYEEERMRPQSYPLHALHLAAHRQFEDRVRRFDQQFAAHRDDHTARVAVLRQLRDYLLSWLEGHIVKVDRALFADPRYYHPLAL
ncbi:MAG: hemerythrin domain-containing protein [Magnetococcus sp. WYHC-3]